MDQSKKYLVIISFDGLSQKDFHKIKEMEGFKELLSKASYCSNVSSVYPSLTYPAHASISTGLYPADHGVINNTKLQPQREHPDWYWYVDNIQGETFFERAEEEGIKTASIMWPVSAGAAISYNMPEILPNRLWETQFQVSLKAGTPLFQLNLLRRFGKLLKGTHQPMLDDFIHASFLHTLGSLDLGLYMVHYTDLDHMRHYHGFDSKEAMDALGRHGERLQDIIQLLQEEGIYEDTNLIVLGDHSSMDFDKSINLNAMFLNMGYLQVKKGVIGAYKAIAKSCEGSCYLYITDPEAVEPIYFELMKLKEKGILEEVHTTGEAVFLGADPDCTFMLEAATGYYFTDQVDKNPISGLNSIEEGMLKVNGHGYSPSKPDYGTVFIAKGPDIMENVEISHMSLIDEGPTFARLLGFELQDAQGRVLEEILKPGGLHG